MVKRRTGTSSEQLSDRVVIAAANGRCFSVSREVAILYDAYRRDLPLDRVMFSLGAFDRPVPSAIVLSEAIRRVVARIDGAPSLPASRPAFGHLVTVPIVSARWVSSAARLFGPLLSRFTITVALVSSIGVIVAACRQPHHLTATSFAWFVSYVLAFATMAFHELGHASALSRFGRRPKSIGFTMFYLFPALYSDVTDAWTLPRRQRVCVDLAGLLFQAYATGVLAALSFCPSIGSVCFHAVVLSLSSMLFNITPIFRFDGYWALADALDAPFLANEPVAILRQLLLRRRIRRSPLAIGIVLAYGTLNALATSAFAYVGVTYLVRMPHVAMRLCAEVAADHISFGIIVSVLLTVVACITIPVTLRLFCVSIFHLIGALRGRNVRTV